MATAIASAVNTSGVGSGRRMFTLSNGNAMCVLTDATTVKVYETSAADRKSGWTLRANFTPTGFDPQNLHSCTAALFSDNSLAIITTGFATGATSRRITYNKMTYSGYSVGATEVIASGVSTLMYQTWNAGAFDVDVTDTDAVLVSLMYYNTVGYPQVCSLFGRSTGGTWTSYDQTLYAGPGAAGSQYSTIQGLGITSTTRRVVFATCAPYNQAGIDYDPGFLVWTTTFNESTGTWATPTQQVNYASGYLIVGKNNASAYQRGLKLFRGVTNADQYHLGYGVGIGAAQNAAAGYHRGTWDGTTWSSLQAIIMQEFSSTGSPLGQVEYKTYANVGITFGTSGMAFDFPADLSGYPGDPTHCGIMQVYWGAGENGNFPIGWARGQWLDGGQECWGVASGGRRNASNKHDTMFMGRPSDFTWFHTMAPTLPVPTTTYPSNGITVPTATPTLQAVVQYLEYYWAPSRFRGEWEISQDPAFATGVRSYNKTELFAWYTMDGSNSVPVTLSEGPTGYSPLTAGIWYIRARSSDTYGNVSAWTSDTRQFTIGHPPTAIPLAPLDNTKFDYGSGTKSFSWQFSDSSSTDTQTAYQVRVKVGDGSGAVISDTGKVVSTATSVVLTIPSANKNQTLYWEVRLWDTDDAAGLYSTGNSFFTMVDPASASVNSPTPGQVLTTAVPTLAATVTATGGRVVKRYSFVILSAGQVVWVGPQVLGSWGNGVSITQPVPATILTNNSQYSVQVQTLDDQGMYSTSPSIAFSTSWTAVASVTTFSVDTSHFNVEGEGFVRLNWTDANRESGFVKWNIYRRDDIIDPNTQAVLQTGTYQYVYSDARALAGSYTWDDYFAPAGVKVNYLIKQVVNRSGAILESENTTAASGFPVTDGYWLIDTSVAPAFATKLHFVKDDTYTDEQEEAEYIVIGRGRHVDKGEYLGPKGSLTVQIRHTQTQTARQIRLKLLDLQLKLIPLYLRNPFGDVLKVNVSSMQVGRLAGVGTSEFCDVTIPYAKVG